MTRRAFVIGHPISHSLSPAMHNAALAALGVDARYEAVDVEPQNLAGWVRAAHGRDLLGFNVTIPHKEAIMASLDAVEGDARWAGAVNTVVPGPGQTLRGTNTDTEGFRRSLAEEAGTSVEGQNVVLLGAGGAARAIAVVALRDGAAQLTVINRHPERAEKLLSDLESLRGAARVRALSPDDPGALALVNAAAVLINATSVGMASDDMPVDASALPPRGLVVDIVYNPAETALLRAARALGARTLGGLGMLVFQAAAALELWTGLRAPVASMRAAAEHTLSQRTFPHGA